MEAPKVKYTMPRETRFRTNSVKAGVVVRGEVVVDDVRGPLPFLGGAIAVFRHNVEMRYGLSALPLAFEESFVRDKIRQADGTYLCRVLLVYSFKTIDHTFGGPL